MLEILGTFGLSWKTSVLELPTPLWAPHRHFAGNGVQGF